MMNRLFKIINKNLKLLVRSKSSALIVIFGPLLIIFLVGIAFDNSNPYMVKIGTYSESYSELSNNITDQLSEAQFKVSKFDSEERCIEGIKEGSIHTCIVFSKNLQMAKKNSNEVLFYVDYSKINLVWMIMDAIGNKLEKTEESLSKDLTGNLLTKINFIQEEVSNDKELLQKLNTGNDDVKKDIESIYSKLNSLDFSIDMNNFGSNQLNDMAEAISELSGYVAQHALDGLTGARVAVKDLNITSEEKNEIYQIIDESRSKVENIQTKIALNNANLSILLDDVNSNLDGLQSKFSDADSERNVMNIKIDGIKKSLTEGFESIMAIQASFNKIEESISNIQITDAENIVSPIKTTIKPLTSEKTHLNYLLPSLVVLVVMFISLILASTLVIMEKKSSAYFRNFITPTKDIIFILATYLTSLFLLFLQLVIILIVASLFLLKDLFYSLLNIIPLSLLIVTLFTLVGMLIGYIFNSEETSTLASISVGTIFLLLSSVIIPLESMPEYLISIAQFNPFVISEAALRKTIVFGYGIDSILIELGFLLAYSAILFLAVLLAQKISKKRTISKYTKTLAPKNMKKSK